AQGYDEFKALPADRPKSLHGGVIGNADGFPPTSRENFLQIVSDPRWIKIVRRESSSALHYARKTYRDAVIFAEPTRDLIHDSHHGFGCGGIRSCCPYSVRKRFSGAVKQHAFYPGTSNIDCQGGG